MNHSKRPLWSPPLLPVLMTLLCSLSRAEADSWLAPQSREFKSPSGLYSFEVRPDKKWPEKPGYCLGTLYKAEPRTKSKVWSRYLVNDCAPVDVSVADNGRYVVTLDDWGHVGSLPVVIYGHRGKVVMVHNLDSLFNDRAEVTLLVRSISSVWWRDDAITFFGPEEKTFCIWLLSGKKIILHLGMGRVLGPDLWQNEFDPVEAYARRQIPEEVMKRLRSRDPSERKTGAVWAGRSKVRQAIPLLKELLRDQAKVLVNPGDRAAAKVALEQMGESVGPVTLEKPPAKE